ncbi:MAG: hypothetical protein JW982_06960 [Spirochaetes bacterium]|nr:hypothetical protein [Spirochaetota bacterium]
MEFIKDPVKNLLNSSCSKPAIRFNYIPSLNIKIVLDSKNMVFYDLIRSHSADYNQDILILVVFPEAEKISA